MKYLGLFLAILIVSSCQNEERNYTPVPPGPTPLPPGGRVDPPDPVQPLPGFVSFEAFESEALTDLTSLSSVQQLNARYLTVCDQLNAGYITPAIKQGVQKGINQISLDNLVDAGEWIGESKCTLRIDLRDFGLTPKKWRIIEQADLLQFESFTDRGILIKQLTQSRRSWILGSNFLETALVNETYYNILEIPNNLGQFLASIGCDLQRDFDDFSEDLFLAAVRRSLIALQKNRTVLTTECDEGMMASTYDVILEAQTSPERSLSINPFPVEARSGRVFFEDAQEFIFTLPNQMLGYALFANGLRENFAPTNIVVDNTRANIDPTIRNARSCSGCHTGGFIEVDDFITDHVTGNPNFNANDIQKAQAYFGRNQGMKAAIRQANQQYQNAVRSLEIDINSPDPINELTDKIRTEMTAKQVASMLFLQEGDFINRLRSSANGSLAIGQLITGGTISFQDLVLIAPTLIQDLNLFQEDLGQ